MTDSVKPTIEHKIATLRIIFIALIIQPSQFFRMSTNNPFATTNPFATSLIPQADRLEKVIETIEAVNDGAKTDEQIGEAISYTDRQGRYYRHAAQILGFIDNENNSASPTPEGQALAMAEPDEKIRLIRSAIVKNRFFASVVNFFQTQNNGVSSEELRNHVTEISDNTALSTIPRRVNTILSWLQFTDIILEDEDGRYYYNKASNVELDEAVDDPPVYPPDFSELDISEQKMTVFEILRKSQNQKIIYNPDFQRNLVWKKFQKSQFIESLILNIPIPPIYTKLELDGRLTIIDGLQRTATLRSFLDDKDPDTFVLEGLRALKKFNGLKFSELPDNIKTRIEDKQMFIFTLKPHVPMEIVYDIFNRINTGGTKLERQEIRNCIFIGTSTTLLKELSETPEFIAAIDSGITPTRMKDREAVLRVLAFMILDYEHEYNNSMDEFLETAMKKINKMGAVAVSNLRNEFLRVMRRTFEFFGKDNFRVSNDTNRGRINIALIESVSYFFANNADKYLIDNKQQIVENYHLKLLKHAPFLDSIKYSTGSSSNVEKRISLANQLLSPK